MTRQLALLTMATGLATAACKKDIDGTVDCPEGYEPTEDGRDCVPIDTASADTGSKDTGPGSGDSGDSGDSGHDSGHTGDTGEPKKLPSFDCSTVLSKGPLKEVFLEAPRGRDDVAFDAEGAMIGSDNDVLWRATSPTEAEVWAPGVQKVYQMDYLHDGDLVTALSTGELIRVSPDGVDSVIVADAHCYSVVVGKDGMVYCSARMGIKRVDPDTGEKEILIKGKDYKPRAMNFSRDWSVMYFGTQNSDGEIHRVELDEDMNLISEPEVLVADTGGWHDSLNVSACGNIYFTGVFGTYMGRVNADLSVDVLLDWDFQNYGHGIEWGVARGGWDEMAIYQPHPYIGTVVAEVVVGEPGRAWEGEVIGGHTL